jgi:hypothetical protein
MINAQPEASASSLTNPLLAQTEAKIEANIADQQVKIDYQKIVVAGLHIALQNGPNSFMAKLKTSRDPIGDCARSAAALVMIMRQQARGIMPIKAMVPAGITLMLHGLDFIDRAKIAQVAEPELDRATTTYTNEIFHRLGITTQMIGQLSGRMNQIVQNPVAMHAINVKAGLVRHPMSLQPMPMPGGPAPTPAPAATRPGGRG